MSELKKIEGNGKLTRPDDLPCPFYDLGSADFHSFRLEIVSEVKRMADTLDKLINASITMGRLIIGTFLVIVLTASVSILGAKVFHEVMEHVVPNL
jgi:hypothetical protein